MCSDGSIDDEWSEVLLEGLGDCHFILPILCVRFSIGFVVGRVVFLFLLVLVR